MSNKANQESICTNGTLNILQSPQGAENRAGTQTLVDTSAEQKGRDLYIQAESCHDRAAPPAEQQAEPGAVYAELPAPTASIGIDDAWHEAAMRDFADRTHALRIQAAPKAAPGEPPGIQALMCVISSLRDIAHFSDEEGGELMSALCALRDWAYAQTTAFQPSPTAQAADSVQEDAARLDWLEQHDGRYYNLDKVASIVGTGFLPSPKATCRKCIARCVKPWTPPASKEQPNDR